jgi:hypothetical protein
MWFEQRGVQMTTRAAYGEMSYRIANRAGVAYLVAGMCMLVNRQR